MSRLAQKAAGAVWWSSLEIASRYGVQFVVTIVLARLLTPSEFGVVALALVFTTIAAVFVDSGFGTALIQRGRPTADDRVTVAAYSMAVAIVLATALAFAAPVLAGFFGEPGLATYLRVAAWVLPFSAASVVPDALLTLRLAFRARTLAQLAASITSGAAGIFLAWRGAGAWSLVVQLLVAAAMRSMMLMVLCGKADERRGRVSLTAFRRLAGFGTYMLLSGIIDALLMRVQALILGRFADARQVGFYTLAQSAQQVPALLVGTVLNRVGLPIFVEIADDAERMRGAMSSALRASMFCFAPCMLVISVMAKPIVVLLYGPSWIPASPLVSVLAIGTLWWPLHVLNLAALSALGRSDLFFRLELAKAAVVVITLAVASPFGALAIASATATSSVVAIFINTWYSRRMLGYGLPSQLLDVAAPLAASAIAAATAFVVYRQIPERNAAIYVAILAAAIAFVGLAIVFRMRAGQEFLLLLRRGSVNRDATS